MKNAFSFLVTIFLSACASTVMDSVKQTYSSGCDSHAPGNGNDLRCSSTPSNQAYDSYTQRKR